MQGSVANGRPGLRPADNPVILDDKTRALIVDKIVTYARGTTESYLGDFGDGYVCLMEATFAMHASAMFAQGKPLEEALVDMVSHLAALYPKIYRMTEEAVRLVATEGQA